MRRAHQSKDPWGCPWHTCPNFPPHPAKLSISALCLHHFASRLTIKLLSVEESFIRSANCGAHAEYAYCRRVNHIVRQNQEIRFTHVRSARQSHQSACNDGDGPGSPVKRTRHIGDADTILPPSLSRSGMPKRSHKACDRATRSYREGGESVTRSLGR